MGLLMILSYKWMQLNSDFIGNAGTAFVSAIIDGFVCKVLLPDN